MSSKSTITRMENVAKLVAKYRDIRKKLKAEGDYAGLARLPRNSCPARLRNLCALTGRSRGVYRKLGISRIKLHELPLALEGKIAGMKDGGRRQRLPPPDVRRSGDEQAMALSDTIADMLTRIRNSARNHAETVVIPHSKSCT